MDDFFSNMLTRTWNSSLSPFSCGFIQKQLSAETLVHIYLQDLMALISQGNAAIIIIRFTAKPLKTVWACGAVALTSPRHDLQVHESDE